MCSRPALAAFSQLCNMLVTSATPSFKGAFLPLRPVKANAQCKSSTQWNICANIFQILLSISKVHGHGGIYLAIASSQPKGTCRTHGYTHAQMTLLSKPRTTISGGLLPAFDCVLHGSHGATAVSAASLDNILFMLDSRSCACEGHDGPAASFEDLIISDCSGAPLLDPESPTRSFLKASKVCSAHSHCINKSSIIFRCISFCY
jgi:hypothetical protein